MPRARWLVVGVLVGALGALILWCDEDDQPADLREYHGGPSGVVCGRRWSYDHEGFYCDNGSLRIAQLMDFRSLTSVSLRRARLFFNTDAAVGSVRSLNLDGMLVDVGDVGRAFPNLEYLGIRETDFDFGQLPPMAKFELVAVNRARPINLQDLARQPALRRVLLGHLLCDRCEHELAEELRRLRPDLVVEAYPIERQKVDAREGDGAPGDL